MNSLRAFFQTPLYGDYGQDTVAELCWCVGILLAAIIFKRLLTRGFVHILFRFLKKQAGKSVGFDKLYLLIKKPVGNFILLLAIYAAFDKLSFPNEWHLGPPDKFGIKMVIERTYAGLLIISISFMMLRMVDYFGLVLKHKAKLNASKSDDQLVPFFKECVKVLIIVLSIFTVLGSVFKINIASLIAGLGIGGLAVALAAKESLENLMGSFTIFLDKPFLVGDHVKISTMEGNVESIGFRSTRIRTVENTLVTVPNKKMVDAELDNLTQRSHRRVKFNISLVYSTKPDQIRAITNEIRSMLGKETLILPTDLQVRLHEFATNSINILVLYYLDSSDWDSHMDILERVNFNIMDIIARNGTDFASQSPAGFIHLEKH